MLKRLVTAAALVTLFAAAAFAQCRTGAPARVAFVRGSTSARVESVMRIKGDACYSLRARAGQQMIVSLSSAHDFARFNVFPPSKDHTIASETAEWSGVLPETGDYVIAVYPRTDEEAGSFTLDVTVNAAPANAAPTATPAPSDTSSAGGAGGQGYTFDAGEGAYVFDGKPPVGFAGLEALELPGVLLRLGANNSIVSVSTDPHAWVDTRSGRQVKQFKSKRVTLNGDEISFETEAVGGVSYQFTGRFYKDQVDKGQLLNATLKGQIVKLVNGKKVAAAQLNLYQAVGG
ncbi:MAG: hypothetical protein ABR563_00975 [Pyrinomonadaceae bacterium]